jgi:hypothetical protein
MTIHTEYNSDTKTCLFSIARKDGAVVAHRTTEPSESAFWLTRQLGAMRAIVVAELVSAFGPPVTMEVPDDD